MTTKKKTGNKKANGGSTKRAKPLVPRAGIKTTRYGGGGKLCK